MRLLLFLLLIFPITKFYCQEIGVKGKIIDANGKAISYVNIGILNKEIGTVSNINGFFELFLDKKFIADNDSLKISCLGFDSKFFLVKNIIDNNITVKLKEKIVQLSEVIILPSNKKATKTLKNE